MDTFNQIIESLSKEEARNYKMYVSRINAAGTRKDKILFDLVRKNKKNNTSALLSKLSYNSANALYRLKNRVAEDICTSLIMLHSRKTDESIIYRNLILHDIFKNKSNLSLSLYYLKKAERKATEAEKLELLDIIYSYYIRLSNDHQEINPEIYIHKQRENAVHLSRIRMIDQALASAIHRLKTTQTFGSKPTQLLRMLDKYIKEFSRDEFLETSKVFQTKLYRAVSQQLLQTHQYPELETFTKNTLRKFFQNNWFDKNNHDIKIQMRIYLINSLFKNEKYQESLLEADKLKEELLEYNRMHYAKFIFFYYNALYMNYAKIDMNRAIEALDSLEKEMKKLKNTYYEQFILLNKSTLLFELNRFDEAIRMLARLYINDSYQKASDSFKLKINTAELIMQWESGDMEVFKKRLKQVRKTFEISLSKKESIYDKIFLDIIEEMSKEDWEKNHKLIRKVGQFILTLEKNKAEDTGLLNYARWLKSKFSIA